MVAAFLSGAGSSRPLLRLSRGLPWISIAMLLATVSPRSLSAQATRFRSEPVAVRVDGSDRRDGVPSRRIRFVLEDRDTTQPVPRVYRGSGDPTGNIGSMRGVTVDGRPSRGPGSRRPDSGERVWIGSGSEARLVQEHGSLTIWEALIAPGSLDGMTVVGLDEGTALERFVALETGDQTMSPPVIGTVTISPSSVVSSEPENTVRVEAQISEPTVGLAIVFFWLNHPGGESLLGVGELVSGTDRDGVWGADIYVPQYSPAGQWMLEITTMDHLFGTVVTPTAHSLTVTGAGDTQPPQVSGIPVVDPTSVDLSSGPVPVTVTATVTDDVAGTMFVSFTFRNGTASFGSSFAPRIDGDAMSGTYQAQFDVPENTPSGTWLLEVSTFDVAGNMADHPTSASVQVSGGDVEPPALTGAVTVVPAAVDVRDEEKIVIVTANLTDNRSGVDYVNFGFDRPETGFGDPAQLVSGDARNGTWRAEVLVPRDSEPGAYTLTVFATDVAGNHLEQIDGTPLTVTGGDTAGPELVAGTATLSPTELDLAAPPLLIQASATVRDAASGVALVWMELELLDRSRSIVYTTAQRVSGNASEGAWNADLEIPADTEPGTYRLVVHAEDAAGNFSSISTSAQVTIVIALPGMPGAPVPEDGATGVYEEPVLGWTEAVRASSYDVFLWRATDPKPSTPLAARVTYPQVTAGTLLPGAEYRWQVHAINGAGRTTGPEWRFTVRTLPDLVVSEIVVPTTALAGQTTEIQWVVRNDGQTATTTPSWTDAVYLSSDAVLDTRVDTRLGLFSNVSYLNPGESYRNIQQITLPRRTFGPLYVLIDTDFGSDVREIDESNNVGQKALQVDLPPMADFQAETLLVPPDVFSGQYFEVQWTVFNRGGAATYEPRWTDAVYLSPTAEPDPTRAVWRTRTSQTNLTLPADGSYTASANLYIPDSLSGTFYVHLDLDVFDDEFEPGGESNNHRMAEVLVTLSPPPDLVPTSVVGPVSGASGKPVSVTWTMQNQGLSETRTSWSDRLYLSPTPVFDPATAHVLGAAWNGRSLEPDSSYTSTAQVKLPNGVSGTYYLAVSADWNRRVFEGPFETNNQLVSGASIDVELSPWPDLRANGVRVTGSLTAGETVTVSWQLDNGGSGIAEPSWTDSLYLSADPIFDRARSRPLGALRRTQPIQPGASAVQTLQVALPHETSGSYYLHVLADAGLSVYEHADEGNNVGSSPALSIAGYPPTDLAVTGLTAPTTVRSGSVVAVSMTVKNLGAGRTRYPFWENGLYLSNDETLDTAQDILLGSEPNLTALGQNQSAVTNLNVTIGHEHAGTRYLIARADVSGAVSDSDRSNNVRSLGPITVQLPPAADLVVESVDAPSNLVSGQPVTVSWIVRNAGPAVTSDTLWYDAVFLSPTVSSLDGYRMWSEPHSGQLAVGGSYARQAAIDVPLYASGRYYLVFETDAVERVYEQGTRGSNTVAVPVVVTSPPPSDLVVGEVLVPANAPVGQEVTISWTLRNDGQNPAVGKSTSGVYISTDRTWDAQDPLVGLHVQDLSLAPGQSALVSGKVSPWSALVLDASGNVTGRMPGVVPGSYYALVRADLRNNLPETNEANNTTASAGQMAADVPSLPLGVPVTDGWQTTNDRFYRVEPGAGVDLRLSLSQAQPFAGGVFVSHGRMPAQSSYDFADATLDFARKEVVVPTTSAGAYYVLFRTDRLVPGQEQFIALAEALSFSVSTISPEVGGQGPVTARIRGAGFRQNSRVFLRNGGGIVTEAVVLSVPSTVEIIARLDLANVPLGRYDVVVRNDAVDTALDQGFEVEPVRPPVLELVRNVPARLLVDRPVDYILQFRNLSNTDIPFANITLSVPSTTLLSLAADSRLLTRSELAGAAGAAGSQGPVTDYVESAGYRLVPLVARNVIVGERFDVILTLTPQFDPSAEFPFRADWQLQDRTSFLSAQLERIESGRRAILASPGRADPGWTALAQDPVGFAQTVLDGYVQIGLLDASDVALGLGLIGTAGKGGPGTTQPGFLLGGADAQLSVASGSSCEEFFNWLSCPLAVGDCFIDIPFVPLTAGQSAALCVFGVATACGGIDVGLAGCIGVLSAINCIAKELVCRNLVFSLDPNDITGPDGYGDRRWVSVRQNLAYKIRFENDPKLATAPAQVVRISLPIDPNLDERSFRTGSFGFGGMTFEVPANTAYYSGRLDLRDSLGIYVDVNAGIDVQARQAFWILRSVDPATGAQPNDPFAGLLPVNDDKGRGEGFVTFTIRPRMSAATGDSAKAQARIVFDLNEPIDTPPTFNTIDAGSPQSRILGYSLLEGGTQVELTWNADDDPGGSGLRDFALYSSRDNQPFQLVRSGLTGTSVVLSRESTDLYRYYLIASDQAGNVEPSKQAAEIVVTTEPTPGELPTQFELGRNYPNPFNPSTIIPFALPKAGDVEFTIYDLLGRRVERLDLGRMFAGRYEQRFELGSFASGVYLYEIRVHDQHSLLFRDSGKLILLK